MLFRLVDDRAGADLEVVAEVLQRHRFENGLRILVMRAAGSRRDQVPYDHILLETGKEVRVSLSNQTRLSERPVIWEDEVYLSWHSDSGIILAG